QAIEKSIKAVLVHYKIEFRLVHDIDYLISLLPKTTPMPPNTRELVTMTIYAVMLRYPGDYEDITKEEYEWSIKAAKEVYHWAENIIKH
ncbi:MAG: HEPN domain-containing protein, partial [Ignavibacteriales bacterium]|nr:HEPN domain-containing protein [Ignavibacteriales bacterium]